MRRSSNVCISTAPSSPKEPEPMRLATLRLDGGTAAVRVDSDSSATVIDGYADLSALLADANWKSAAEQASGRTVDLGSADYAPVVPAPGKIVCVGLNYATHIKE